MAESMTEFAARLHSERGIKVTVECSKAVDASLISDELAGSGRLSLKLLYIGCGGDDPDIADGSEFIREDDSYVYKMLGSPCPFILDQNIATDPYRSPKGDLWLRYFLQVFLKDRRIAEKGLRIRLLVPDIIASKAPVLTVKCNEEVLYSSSLREPGIIDITLDILGTAAALVDYLMTVHRHQMLLLEEIIRVCRKYGLRYYLCYGTLLGAVRNGNIITWDDDVDVCMPRDDYDILMEKSSEEWPEGSDFALVRPDGYGKDFFLDFMTRLVYMGETEPSDPFSRIPEGLPWHYHLPLDIYTLDAASDDERQHARRAARLRLLYVLGLSRRKGFDEKTHAHLGARVLLASRILRFAGKVIPLRWIFRSYEKTARSQFENTGNVFMSNGYYLCYGDTYPGRLFNNSREVQLGELNVKVPSCSEELLSKIYGEYYMYPAVWARKPNHYSGFDGFMFYGEKNDKASVWT